MKHTRCYSDKFLCVVARVLLNGCYGVFVVEISPPSNLYAILVSRCGYRSFDRPSHDLSHHYWIAQASYDNIYMANLNT